MLEWLKTILGDTYTEDIDKKVSEEIGKQFVSRAEWHEKRGCASHIPLVVYNS